MKFWKSVHVLRAVAASLVVAHHIPQFVTERSTTALPSFECGAAGVDIFFVISGLVMYSTTRARSWDWKDFLEKRLIRVLPLYWLITSVLSLAALLVPSLFRALRVTWGEFLGSMLFLPLYDAQGYIRPVVGVGWTLYYELFFYSVVTAALALRLRTAAGIWAALTLTLASVLTYGLGLTRLHTVGQLLSPIVIEFALGVMVAHVATQLSSIAWSRAWRRGCGAATIVTGCAVIATYGTNDLSLSRFLTWGVGGAMVVLGFTVLEPEFARLSQRFPLLVRLGDASYALYLTQSISFSILWKLLPSQLRVEPAAVAVLLLCGAVVGSVLVNALIETPLMRLVKRMLQRPSSLVRTTSPG
jgi:exopolysaccharide production protein ExoZ